MAEKIKISKEGKETVEEIERKYGLNLISDDIVGSNSPKECKRLMGINDLKKRNRTKAGDGK